MLCMSDRHVVAAILGCFAEMRPSDVLLYVNCAPCGHVFSHIYISAGFRIEHVHIYASGLVSCIYADSVARCRFFTATGSH